MDHKSTKAQDHLYPYVDSDFDTWLGYDAVKGENWADGLSRESVNNQVPHARLQRQGAYIQQPPARLERQGAYIQQPPARLERQGAYIQLTPEPLEREGDNAK
ncbi:hypothetical protein BGX28_001572 [Mortierella sp. GBA30]|nr:hypothetical protein BGX28_001572 [Mortierella sp. GBA30]